RSHRDQSTGFLSPLVWPNPSRLPNPIPNPPIQIRSTVVFQSILNCLHFIRDVVGASVLRICCCFGHHRGYIEPILRERARSAFLKFQTKLANLNLQQLLPPPPPLCPPLCPPFDRYIARWRESLQW